MRLTACDQCGYLLDSVQARTRCPECGLSPPHQYREDARKILERPAYLALLALVLWRSLPLALWSTPASARAIRRTRRHSRRLWIWTLTLGAVLVLLQGSIRAHEWEILERPGGYHWRDNWYGLWGLDSSRATTTKPVSNLNSLLLQEEDARAEPPYSLLWMPQFDSICERWRVKWGQVAFRSRYTQQLVFLPTAACMLSLLILSFASRLATHRSGEIQLSRLSRATLMAAASAACVTPVRLAWFAAFLVSVPFFLAPSVGLPLRRAAWHFLVLFATMGPSLIAARIVLADRPGNYIRWRKSVSLILVLFGGVVPGILGRYILLFVDGTLFMLEVEHRTTLHRAV